MYTNAWIVYTCVIQPLAATHTYTHNCLTAFVHSLTSIVVIILAAKGQ